MNWQYLNIYQPPTQLPPEFDSRVKVYKMTDCAGFPGHVNLISSHLLKGHTDNDKFEYIAEECQGQIKSRMILRTANGEDHGPAVVTKVSRQPTALYVRFAGSIDSRDTVYCMRCLLWPPQAEGWRKRQRDDWPKSAIIDRVIESGCDVVTKAHYLARKHSSKEQWRLSFSRAEYVLLRSWMPIQQIVYHVLRDFLRTRKLTDNEDEDTLSNYHIKTLMLWTCESKPRSWWIEDINVVRICVELIHKLADWLSNKCCPHYFINDSYKCNLFYNLDKTYCTDVAIRLNNLVTRKWFSKWFITSYIRRCAQSYSNILSRLFKQVNTSRKLQDALLAVPILVQRNWFASSSISRTNCLVAQYTIALIVCFKSINLRSCSHLMTVLAKHHKGLLVYFSAVTFLHIAYKTVHYLLTDYILDVLLTTVLWPQHVDARHCLISRHSSLLSLTIATMLMKVVANNSRSTVQLIEIELAKAYLYRALRCKDPDSDSIYCLANVYLAVLYYTTGNYQRAIDLCTLVTRSQDRLQCSSHVVQGDILCLQKIDSIFDLVVFQQCIGAQSAVLSEEQDQHGSDFNKQLFECYLHIRYLCSHIKRMSLTDAVQRYRKYVPELPEMFVTDQELLRILAIPTIYRRRHRKMIKCTNETKPCKLDTSELVELLQQSAVERLTKFRQLEAQEFASLGIIVTTDFEALYAYRYGEYTRCLQLSTKNVLTLIADPMSVPSIHAFPEFIQLINDDIVALIGLTVFRTEFLNKEYRQDCFPQQMHQLSLSLYLMAQCQIKLHHSVTSLERTLDYVKVACWSPCYQLFTLGVFIIKLTQQNLQRQVANARFCEQGAGPEERKAVGRIRKYCDVFEVVGVSKISKIS